MTREEAIAKAAFPEKQFILQNDWGVWLVDSLVALGLLNLEEPKSVEQKTHDALYNAPIGCYACAPTNFIIGSREAEEIINHLARAGLTIVEKQHGE